MKTKMISSILLLFFGIILPSQERLLAQTNMIYPFSIYDQEVCNGELVDFTGFLHVLSRMHVDGAGNKHCKLHFNAKGEGIGKTTGASYLFIDGDNESVYFDDSKIITFQQSFKLIGKGQVSSGHMHIKMTFVINGKGVDVLDITHDKVKCN